MQNIWHTDDEMPESGKTILIKGLEWNNTVDGYTLFNTRTDIGLGDFDEKKKNTMGQLLRVCRS